MGAGHNNKNNRLHWKEETAEKLWLNWSSNWILNGKILLNCFKMQFIFCDLRIRQEQTREGRKKWSWKTNAFWIRFPLSLYCRVGRENNSARNHHDWDFITANVIMITLWSGIAAALLSARDRRLWADKAPLYLNSLIRPRHMMSHIKMSECLKVQACDA